MYSILKFGVAIVNEDRRRLFARNGIKLSGCVDLNHIAGQCGVAGIVGLKGLAKSLLDVKMDKSYRVKTSNWEEETLSTDQVGVCSCAHCHRVVAFMYVHVVSLQLYRGH